VTPPHLLAASFADAGVMHGFFGRAGGVSTGIYASLNTGLGTDDDPGRVRENRARCAKVLGVDASRLMTVHQVHSADVVIVREPWDIADRPKADATVTDRPGIALGVLAADCMPVLFVDLEARIIGAAHAGWRGALSGVLEATVAAMERLGARPSRIRAALGPCLRQDNFEVGLDLLAEFERPFPASRRFFAPGVAPDKRQLDLAGFARWRLSECGVDALEDLDACTLDRPQDHFSYRASRRAGEGDYGRNLSAIALVSDKTRL